MTADLIIAPRQQQSRRGAFRPTHARRAALRTSGRTQLVDALGRASLFDFKVQTIREFRGIENK